MISIQTMSSTSIRVTKACIARADGAAVGAGLFDRLPGERAGQHAGHAAACHLRAGLRYEGVLEVLCGRHDLEKELPHLTTARKIFEVGLRKPRPMRIGATKGVNCRCWPQDCRLPLPADGSLLPAQVGCGVGGVPAAGGLQPGSVHLCLRLQRHRRRPGQMSCARLVPAAHWLASHVVCLAMKQPKHLNGI